MASKKVLHKRSNIEGKAPSAEQLDYGELAINYYGGKEQLYIKNSNNAVVGLIGQSGGGDITSVTASGTSPLTLTSTTNNGAVTIEGSVNLSNYLNMTSNAYVEDIVFKTETVSGKQLPVIFDRIGEMEIGKSYVVYTVYGYVDLSDYAKSSDLPKYWNYYLFEGGSSASTVTIDGSSVSVPANTIVEGNFTTDITAIGTNNLKRIIIRGDVSLSICSSSSSSNTTLEEIDLEFSKSYSRSFDYMFRNLRGLKRLRVAGGQATGAYSMCYYVGSSTDDGCEIDIKGMDFSQMTSSNGASYLCRYAKIASIDLSGHTFSGDTYRMFYNATVGSADVSGCTFGGDAYSIFYGATVGSADVSGCTFNDSGWGWMFYSSTITNLNLSGCDLSGLNVDSSSGIWNNATINSINLNGVTLPTDQTSNWYFVDYLDSATSIGAITGDYGEIGTYRDISLTTLNLRRGSVIAIFDALAPGGSNNCVFISSYSGARITPEDTIIATNKKWTVSY